jgi:hypothetical protein
MDQLNTEGIARVGEIETRAFKEIRVAENYDNVRIGGQVQAYKEIALWVAAQIEIAGPYDDIRHLKYLIVWLGDKIREVQFPATTEARNA